MGFFDEVDSIVINNKEVQSIISSDGGVIYEKSNGYELTLTSDKSIIQTGESATLSATLTNNNVPMAGETIFFYDSNNPPISYSTDGSHDFTVNVGDAFKLYYTSQSPASNSYCAIRDITNSISIYVHKEGNVSITETNISRTTTFNSFSYLKLENGILSNGDGDTCDLSSYTLDFDLVRINNSGTVYFDDSIIGSDVTDGNGVASVGYTGKGTGDLNIQAYYLERIISSEIYSIEDCTYYDTTEYTSNQSLQVPMPSEDFSISAELMYTSSRNAYPQLYIGTELNVNNIAFGQMREGGNQGFEFKKNNTRVTFQEFNSTQSSNTWYHIELKRENDLYTLIWNNNMLTYTNDNVIVDYLFLIYLPNGKCKNIKIKQL